MNKVKWFRGPPPSQGWWPASVHRDPTALRWRSASGWSGAARRGDSLEAVAYIATTVAYSDIEWTDRPASWPKRSRT